MNASTRFPWRKDYPGQRLTDPRIVFLSLPARGLLWDVEALAYCGEAPGKLTIQGRPMTGPEIARLRGIDPAEVEKPLAEILASGLLDRDADGTIFSPSLVSELRERDGIRQRVTRHRQNTAHNVTPTVTDKVTPKIRKEKRREERRDKKGASPNGSDDLFESFWDLYPNHKSKPKAQKAFAKLDNPAEVLPKIRTALAWQIPSRDWQKEEGAYIPHPATYLNNRRWEDEPASNGSKPNHEGGF